MVWPIQGRMQVIFRHTGYTHYLTWVVRSMFCMGLNIYTQYPFDVKFTPHCIHRYVSAESLLGQLVVSGSHLDLNRAPYVLYGVKYIDLVSLW